MQKVSRTQYILVFEFETLECINWSASSAFWSAERNTWRVHLVTFEPNIDLMSPEHAWYERKSLQIHIFSKLMYLNSSTESIFKIIRFLHFWHWYRFITPDFSHTWANAQCNAKKVCMNWFWKSFLYITPALVWTILYITHQLSKIPPWVYIGSFASIFSILWMKLPHQKTLETIKSGPNELPK